MATQTTTPRRGRPAATKAKPEETPVAVEETTSEAELEKIVYTLDNRGRTKGGEGKLDHYNLHERWARGNIFADPTVVEVRVLVVRNPNAEI